MNIVTLKYSATNTYAIRSDTGHILLIDTGYAGTLSSFYKSIKAANITLEQISFILATHYHPDHIGLIPTLMSKDVPLFIADVQLEYIHKSDGIYTRQPHLGYTPIHDTDIKIFTLEDSKMLLHDIGIEGDIISTPSHSPDSISILIDNIAAFVGDLVPITWLDKTAKNDPAVNDWKHILKYNPQAIYYGHAPALDRSNGLPQATEQMFI